MPALFRGEYYIDKDNSLWVQSQAKRLTKDALLNEFVWWLDDQAIVHTGFMVGMHTSAYARVFDGRTDLIVPLEAEHESE